MNTNYRLDKEALRDLLIALCTDENGNLDLNGLDFSNFNGDINISGMKVKKDLCQKYQIVGGDLWQDSQNVNGTIFQDNQTFGVQLFQHYPNINNHNISIKDFFNRKETIWIHCDTEEKAIKLLEAFNKLGYKWNDGDSYLKNTCWNKYKKDTVYSNKGFYDNIQFSEYCNSYNGYEFDEVIFEEE